MVYKKIYSWDIAAKGLTTEVSLQYRHFFAAFCMSPILLDVFIYPVIN